MEMEIDGVGGVSILAKARVFRSGVHFPAFSFEKHAETEGFGKVCSILCQQRYILLTKHTQMAKRMKFSVVGLPHYTIWHLYEPSADDIRHMEEMEKERKQKEQEEKEKQERLKKINDQFDNPSTQWDKDKSDIKNIAKQEKEKAKVEKKKGEVEEAENTEKAEKIKESDDDVKARALKGEEAAEEEIDEELHKKRRAAK
jgi:mannan polymerase II complex ANP1 subunit